MLRIFVQLLGIRLANKCVGTCRRQMINLDNAGKIGKQFYLPKPMISKATYEY